MYKQINSKLHNIDTHTHTHTHTHIYMCVCVCVFVCDGANTVSKPFHNAWNEQYKSYKCSTSKNYPASQEHQATIA